MIKVRYSNVWRATAIVFAGAGLAVALAFLAAAGSAAPPVAQAEALNRPAALVRLVSKTGNDTNNDCTAISTPCLTIQHALDEAEAGDDIHVAGGTYSGTMSSGSVTAVVAITKNIASLMGGYSADFATRNPDAHETILDATGYTGTFVVWISGTNMMLDGFTLTGATGACPGNCATEVYNGGAVHIEGVGRPTISNNRIQGNRAYALGAGIYVSGDTSPTIASNLIYSNSVVSKVSPVENSNGGGIYVASGAAMIAGNEIIFNSVASQGGGIWAGGSATIMNNVIAYNRATTSTESFGGAIYIGSGQVTIADNEIHDNAVAAGSAGAGIYVAGNARALIQHNDLLSNSGGDGSAIRPCQAGQVTVDSNRVFFNLNTASSGSAIAACPAQTSPISLTNNVVVSNTGNGIDLNQSMTLVNNTIAFNSGNGVTVSLVVSATAFNNIAFKNGGCGFGAGPGGYQLLDYNDAFANGTNYCGATPGSHSISADPRFVDVATDDYHVTFASPARDAGRNAGAPAHDFDGNSRPQGKTVDMGAYEVIVPHVEYLPMIFK